MSASKFCGPARQWGRSAPGARRELTVPVQLKKGTNTIGFRSEELPKFDGTTYASDTFPGVLLRSRYAPLIDRISVAPYARESAAVERPVRHA
ncbi:hypothetical protein GCM10010103_56740 [Streptomyces paradoxus]